MHRADRRARACRLGELGLRCDEAVRRLETCRQGLTASFYHGARQVSWGVLWTGRIATSLVWARWTKVSKCARLEAAASGARRLSSGRRLESDCPGKLNGLGRAPDRKSLTLNRGTNGVGLDKQGEHQAEAMRSGREAGSFNSSRPPANQHRPAGQGPTRAEPRDPCRACGNRRRLHFQ